MYLDKLTDDVIDTRDIQERITALENQAELNEDESEELTELNNLKDEIGRGFEDGITLIDYDYFDEYAEDLATECGYVDADCPMVCYIDWRRWADDMRADYSELNYANNNYLYLY